MTYTSYSLNEKYWRQFTEESTQFYKSKMLELAPESELRGSVLGITTPNHWMYKLDTLYSTDGQRGYEFCIEYDTYEPQVGIYYGCKGLTLNGASHDEQIVIFMREWERIKGEVCTMLNNTFPDKEFSHRFKMTNNANDNSFWPFWITLNEDEDIRKVGLRALNIIRQVYKRLLDGESFVCRKNAIKCINVRTAFTNEAYEELLDELDYKKPDEYNKAIKALKKQANIKILEKFLNTAESLHLLYRDYNYEKAWRVTRLSNVDFVRMMSAVFQYMVDNHTLYAKYNENAGTCTAQIPWDKVTKIFLAPDGSTFGKGLRSQRGKASPLREQLEMEKWKEKIAKMLL